MVILFNGAVSGARLWPLLAGRVVIMTLPTVAQSCHVAQYGRIVHMWAGIWVSAVVSVRRGAVSRVGAVAFVRRARDKSRLSG